jgi:hypothetical protein
MNVENKWTYLMALLYSAPLEAETVRSHGNTGKRIYSVGSLYDMVTVTATLTRWHNGRVLEYRLLSQVH